MSSDNVSVLALQIENSQFNTGLRHSHALMRSLGDESVLLTSVLRQTAGAMTGLVVGSGMVKGLLSTIQAASVYREDLAQFNHVMRNVSKQANEMVEALTSDAYGRTSIQARQMLMGLTSLAKGMGMTDKAAVELSGEFSKMAVDIGSFMMVQPESVMNAFQSALMGNTMALRSYGVFLNETMLKETIAANAKKGMVFASEREARAFAILTETQKQQADAIGDYAVEAAQFGNQLKQFYGGISELPAKFGKGLLEPANEFLKVANSMIDKLRGLDDATWQTISTFTSLGTAVSLAFGTYRIGTAAVGMYTLAKQASTAALAGNTVALGGNTGALGANNAATAAGVAGARRAGAAGAVGTAGSVAAARAGMERLPHQSRAQVWDQQLATLRTAHSSADRNVARMDEIRKSQAHKYAQAAKRQRGIITRYQRNVQAENASRNDVTAAMLAGDRPAEIAARRRMNLARGRQVQQQSMYDSAVSGDLARTVQRHRTGASQANTRYLSARQRRENLERNMVSLHEARRRNPTNLTAQQRAANTGVMSRNRSRIRYARAQQTFNHRSRGFRRSPLGLASRGVGSAASAVGQATGLTYLLRSFGTMVSRWIPATARVWGAGILRSVATALLPIGGTILAVLNPLGWAATIVTGLAAVGNYLPTLMYKAYDSFMSLFSEENMSKIWEFFKASALSVYEWLGKGLYGIGLLAESVFYTAINALGNGLRRIVQGVTLGAVDIGKFEYKSSGYAAYEQQKKVNELQAKLDEQREQQAKREKQIAEFRTKVSDQERQWLEKEEALLKKRSELAAGRFDTTAKVDALSRKLPHSEALVGSIDAAMQSVSAQLRTAEAEYIKILQSGQGDDEVEVNGKKVAKKDHALDNYHAVQARYDSLVKQKEEYGTSAMEQRYALFDARFDNIGRLKTTQAQTKGYSALLSELRSAPMLRQQESLTSEFTAAQKTLAEKQQELNRVLASGDDIRAASLREEIQSAEKNLQSIQASYDELQANLSDQRKVREKLDELHKEQERRHRDAKKNLWGFNYEHAGRGAQQQMARSAFFEAQNRFEGARSDEERDRAFQDMQSMYGKIDKPEMPVWNGFLNTTSGAIESNSVAAQELQERILNDFNRASLTARWDSKV